VGAGLRLIVKDEEDLWDRGWGFNEYKLNAINAMVNVPSIKDCMDKNKDWSAAARQEQLSPYGTYVPHVPANIVADAPFDGTQTSRSETGYFGLLSDVNWSPRERVLYNIPPDPQVLPEGLISLHVRRHVARDSRGVAGCHRGANFFVSPPPFLCLVRARHGGILIFFSLSFLLMKPSANSLCALRSDFHEITYREGFNLFTHL
jgi:hypothetical protein